MIDTLTMDTAPAAVEEMQAAPETQPDGLAGAADAASEEAKPPKFVGAEDEDEGKENRVPQWRLNEIARERREAREEAARYKAELEELRAKMPQAKPEVKELDPKDFPNLKAYTDAVLEQDRKRTIAEVEERATQREAQREIQRAQEAMVSEFAAKFESAKAENPEVIKARDHVDNLINTGRLALNPVIAREIMTHEDAPHLVYEIATNPALMDILRSGNTQASLKAIYRFQHKGGAPAASSDSLTMAPAGGTPAPKRPGAPEKVPTGGGGGGLPSDYEAYKRKRLGE